MSTFLLSIMLAVTGGALLGRYWPAVTRAALRHPLADISDVSADASDTGPAEKFITAGLAIVSIVGLVVVLAAVVALYQTIRGGV